MQGGQPGPWHFKAIISRDLSRRWDRERVLKNPVGRTAGGNGLSLEEGGLVVTLEVCQSPWACFCLITLASYVNLSHLT